MIETYPRIDFLHDAKDDDGQTPLHLAARRGKTETCLVLIDNGANLNAEDNWGETPLHFAANRGFADTCVLLVERGANVNAKAAGAGSIAPLYWASLFQQKAICVLLIENGANVDDLLDRLVKELSGDGHHSLRGEGSEQALVQIKTLVSASREIVETCEAAWTRVQEADEEGNTFTAAVSGLVLRHSDNGDVHKTTRVAAILCAIFDPDYDPPHLLPVLKQLRDDPNVHANNYFYTAEDAKVVAAAIERMDRGGRTRERH